MVMLFAMQIGHGSIPKTSCDWNVDTYIYIDLFSTTPTYWSICHLPQGLSVSMMTCKNTNITKWNLKQGLSEEHCLEMLKCW